LVGIGVGARPGGRIAGLEAARTVEQGVGSPVDAWAGLGGSFAAGGRMAAGPSARRASSAAAGRGSSERYDGAVAGPAACT